MKNMFHIGRIGIVVLFGAVFAVGIAHASHSWGGYHWARAANPFTVALGGNVSVGWDGHLATASSDWSASSVLDAVVAPGLVTTKKCSPTAGRAEICNAKYGRNGWLGIASVWVSGEHINKGTVRLNDTYFAMAKYNTPAWKNLVMCQEVGHIFGLDHQDENFTNAPLGTCMDYTNDPMPNQHPNQHDYDMLEALYAHLDAVTTTSGSPVNAVADIDTEDPREWGRERRMSRDGSASLFERDFGHGQKMFTFVVWAEQGLRKHQ